MNVDQGFFLSRMNANHSLLFLYSVGSLCRNGGHEHRCLGSHYSCDNGVDDDPMCEIINIPPTSHVRHIFGHVVLHLFSPYMVLCKTMLCSSPSFFFFFFILKTFMHVLLSQTNLKPRNSRGTLKCFVIFKLLVWPVLLAQV